MTLRTSYVGSPFLYVAGRRTRGRMPHILYHLPFSARAAAWRAHFCTYARTRARSARARTRTRCARTRAPAHARARARTRHARHAAWRMRAWHARARFACGMARAHFAPCMRHALCARRARDMGSDHSLHQWFIFWISGHGSPLSLSLPQFFVLYCQTGSTLDRSSVSHRCYLLDGCWWAGCQEGSVCCCLVVLFGRDWFWRSAAEQKTYRGRAPLSTPLPLPYARGAAHRIYFILPAAAHFTHALLFTFTFPPPPPAASMMTCYCGAFFVNAPALVLRHNYWRDGRKKAAKTFRTFPFYLPLPTTTRQHAGVPHTHYAHGTSMPLPMTHPALPLYYPTSHPHLPLPLPF